MGAKGWGPTREVPLSQLVLLTGQREDARAGLDHAKPAGVGARLALRRVLTLTRCLPVRPGKLFDLSGTPVSLRVCKTGS